jgi:serine/threonine-protein kinase
VAEGEELADRTPFMLAGLAPGQVVAGYRLEEQIGAGGMAVVFRAFDDRLGRRVALKILAPAFGADVTFRQRFVRESRAAAAVDDPHIVPVYEAGEADGLLYIAMRLVPGGDVRTLLATEGPLPPVRVAAVISPVASALDAAHAAGLVHRDVKPANMLLDVRPDRPDHVYLSDFGLSKGAMGAAGLTGLGQFLGTPSYISPEQIQGGDVDGRADQYALACAAYELLIGTPPFARDQPAAVIWAHMSEPPPSLSERRAGLPRQVDAVFAQAMAKRQEDRFDRCKDFAEALRSALGIAAYSSGPQAIPVTLPPMTLEPTVAVARLGASFEPPGSPAGDQVLGGIEVSGVAVSPDGTTVALGSMAGRAGLCAITGELLEDLTGHVAGAVTAVSYRPDGALAAFAGTDGTTLLWDARAARPAGTLRNPGGSGIGALAFGPSGAQLAVGDDHGAVHLWDVAGQRVTATLTDLRGVGVLDLEFSPDGTALAVGDASGVCFLWDLRYRRLATVLNHFGHGEVFCVAWTADGSVLAAGDGSGRICLWDPYASALVSVLSRRRRAEAVFDIAFGPRDLQLAAGYLAGGVTIWHPESGRPLTSLGARDPGAVLAVSFSPDGFALATGSSDGAAWLWDVATRTRIPLGHLRPA